MRRAVDVERGQALVAADAVLDVDHEVAFVERRDLGQEVLRAAPLARRPGDALAEDVLLGDEAGLGRGETGLDLECDQTRGRARQRPRLGPGLDRNQRRQAVLVQERPQAVARAGAVADHQDPAPGRLLGGDVGVDRVEQVGLGARPRLGEIAAAPALGIEDLGPVLGRGEGGELADRALGEPRVPVRRAQVKQLRVQRLVGRSVDRPAALQVLARAEVVGDRLEPGAARLLGLMVEGDRDSCLGHVIEQRRQALVE